MPSSGDLWLPPCEVALVHLDGAEAQQFAAVLAAQVSSSTAAAAAAAAAAEQQAAWLLATTRWHRRVDWARALAPQMPALLAAAERRSRAMQWLVTRLAECVLGHAPAMRGPGDGDAASGDDDVQASGVPAVYVTAWRALHRYVAGRMSLGATLASTIDALGVPQAAVGAAEESAQPQVGAPRSADAVSADADDADGRAKRSRAAPMSPCAVPHASHVLSQLRLAYRMPAPAADRFVHVAGIPLQVAHSDHSPAAAAAPFGVTPSRERLLRHAAISIRESKPLLLRGPPGSGKTALVSHIASLCGNHDLVKLQLGDQTDSKLLLGSYVCTETPGEFEWRAGALTQCVEAGRWLLIEDIDSAPPDVLHILIPLIESGALFVPSRGMSVPAHPNFRLFATETVGSAGVRTRSTLATVERFWDKLFVPALTMDELRDIVTSLFPSLAPMAATLVDLFETITQRQRGRTLRLVTSRDFLKWCRRIHARLEQATPTVLTAGPAIASTPSLSAEDAEAIVLDALDCFAAMIRDRNARNELARLVVERFQLAHQLEYLTSLRHPLFAVADARLTSGRVALPVLPAAAGAAAPIERSAFALTRHAACTLEQLAASVAHREPVLLVGETGMGKTSVVQHLADASGARLFVYNMNQQSDSSDFFGGFKPVSLRRIARQLVDIFDAAFPKTFSATANAKFIQHVHAAFAASEWRRMTKLCVSVNELVAKRLEQDRALAAEEAAESKPVAADADAAARPKRRRKLARSVRSHWREFESLAARFDRQVNAQSQVAFQFVEGKLVECVRHGYWVLLDEVNLAPSETLEVLSGLLENDGLVLTESGSVEHVACHPNFRLFACMNPPGDSGKRDLPPAVRSRFSEYFIDDITDPADLRLIVQQSLREAAQYAPVQAITDLYLELRRLEVDRLIDGDNKRPCYSLRTLTRSLSYALSVMPRFGLPRALFEGFCANFVTKLHQSCAGQVEEMIQTAVLAKFDLENVNRPPKPPGAPHVLIDYFHVERGQEPLPASPPPYFLTPSVRKQLRHLARAAVVRRFPVLLQGPTSAGKTSMVEYLAQITGHKFVRINNHEHTDLDEYLGTYSTGSDGRLTFQEGLLVQAVRNGYWLVLDELNLAPTEVLEALNRLLDDNRELFVPETQEVVRPHPQFMLFATQNPAGSYGGRKVLSRAFRSRFLELHFHDIPADELEEIVSQRCAVAPSWAKRMVAAMQELQRRRQTSHVFKGKHSFITPRDLFRWALREAIGLQQLAENGYMLIAERLRSPAEKEIVREVLEKHLKAKIEPAKLYGAEHPQFVKFVTELQSAAPELASKIVWTSSMRRLVLLVYRALLSTEAPLLVGETGCGKTTACELSRLVMGAAMRTINCHQHTEASDFMGGIRPARGRAQRVHDAAQAYTALIAACHEAGRGQVESVASVGMDAMVSHVRHVQSSFDEAPIQDACRAFLEAHRRSIALFEWQDGPLVQSMRDGAFLLLDEISLADDAVLERINPVLESGRSLVVAEQAAETTEPIRAVEAFRLVATMNPGGDFGKKELSPALANRFSEIWADAFDRPEDMIEVLASRLSVVGAADLARLMFDYLAWVTSHGPTRTTVSLRDLLLWVDFVNLHGCRSGACGCAAPLGASPICARTYGAFLHGAFLAIIDGAGVGSALDDRKRVAARDALVLRLRACAPEAAWTPDLTDAAAAAASLQVRSGDCISVGGFSIAARPDSTAPAPASVAYCTDAPTTAFNMMKIARALSMRRPVLLEGSPGVGKTSLISSLAAVLGHPFVRVNLSDQTDMSDLLGADLPVEDGETGEFSWRDGPLLRAMEEGHWVLLDEMNLASQSVLEGLNSCLDHRAEVFVPELDRVVTCSPRFRIFAAQNPIQQGGGRKGLPKSFLNRFVKVCVDPLSHTDLVTVVCGLYPRVERALVSHMVDFVYELSDAMQPGAQLGRLGSPWEFNLRDVLRWCEASQALATTDAEQHAFDPAAFADLLFAQRLRTEADRAFVRAAFERHFGKPMLAPAAELRVQSTFVQVGDVYVSRQQGVAAGFDARHGHSGGAQLSQQAPQFAAHRPDAQLLRSLAACVRLGWLCILTGHRSSGRTSAVRALARLTNHRLIEFSMNSSIDTTELLGGYEQLNLQRHFHALLERIRCVAYDAAAALLSRAASRFDVAAQEAFGVIQSLADLGELAVSTQSSLERVLARLQPVFDALVGLCERAALLPGLLVRRCESFESLRAQIAALHALDARSATGRFEWVDSLLVRSCQRGDWLVLDNVNFCAANVLDRLNALFEPRGVLQMSERGMVGNSIPTVVPHPEFRVFFVMDSQFGEISRAMRNRGIELYVPPMRVPSFRVEAVLRSRGVLEHEARAMLHKHVSLFGNLAPAHALERPIVSLLGAWMDAFEALVLQPDARGTGLASAALTEAFEHVYGAVPTAPHSLSMVASVYPGSAPPPLSPPAPGSLDCALFFGLRHADIDVSAVLAAAAVASDVLPPDLTALSLALEHSDRDLACLAQHLVAWSPEWRHDVQAAVASWRAVLSTAPVAQAAREALHTLSSLLREQYMPRSAWLSLALASENASVLARVGEQDAARDLIAAESHLLRAWHLRLLCARLVQRLEAASDAEATGWPVAESFRVARGVWPVRRLAQPELARLWPFVLSVVHAAIAAAERATAPWFDAAGELATLARELCAGVVLPKAQQPLASFVALRRALDSTPRVLDAWLASTSAAADVAQLIDLRDQMAALHADPVLAAFLAHASAFPLRTLRMSDLAWRTSAAFALSQSLQLVSARLASADDYVRSLLPQRFYRDLLDALATVSMRDARRDAVESAPMERDHLVQMLSSLPASLDAMLDDATRRAHDRLRALSIHVAIVDTDEWVEANAVDDAAGAEEASDTVYIERPDQPAVLRAKIARHSASVLAVRFLDALSHVAASAVSGAPRLDVPADVAALAQAFGTLTAQPSLLPLAESAQRLTWLEGHAEGGTSAFVPLAVQAVARLATALLGDSSSSLGRSEASDAVLPGALGASIVAHVARDALGDLLDTPLRDRAFKSAQLVDALRLVGDRAASKLTSSLRDVALLAWSLCWTCVRALGLPAAAPAMTAAAVPLIDSLVGTERAASMPHDAALLRLALGSLRLLAVQEELDPAAVGCAAVLVGALMVAVFRPTDLLDPMLFAQCERDILAHELARMDAERATRKQFYRVCQLSQRRARMHELDAAVRSVRELADGIAVMVVHRSGDSAFRVLHDAVLDFSSTVLSPTQLESLLAALDSVAARSRLNMFEATLASFAARLERDFASYPDITELPRGGSSLCRIGAHLLARSAHSAERQRSTAVSARLAFARSLATFPVPLEPAPQLLQASLLDFRLLRLLFEKAAVASRFEARPSVVSFRSLRTLFGEFVRLWRVEDERRAEEARRLSQWFVQQREAFARDAPRAIEPSDDDLQVMVEMRRLFAEDHDRINLQPQQLMAETPVVAPPPVSRELSAALDDSATWLVRYHRAIVQHWIGVVRHDSLPSAAGQPSSTAGAVSVQRLVSLAADLFQQQVTDRALDASSLFAATDDASLQLMALVCILRSHATIVGADAVAEPQAGTDASPSFFEASATSALPLDVPLVAVLQGFLRRVQALLVEAPDNAMLKRLARAADAILALPASVSATRVAALLDSLFLRVSQWEDYAGSVGSLQESFLPVKAVMVQLRRAELQSWPALLATKERACQSSACKAWFRLYGALASDTESSSSSASDVDGGETDSWLDTLTESLDAFMRSATLGDFDVRLQVCSAFADQLAAEVHFAVQSTPSSRATAAISVLRNVAGYYRQFHATIESSLETERATIFKELRDQVSLARWDDTNYAALHASSEKAKQLLAKFAVRYDALLRRAVAPMIESEMDSVFQPTPIADELPHFVQALSAGERDALVARLSASEMPALTSAVVFSESDASTYPMTAKVGAYLQRMRAFALRGSPLPDALVQEIDAVRELSATLLEEIRDIQRASREAEAIADADERDKAVRRTMMTKRSAFSTLLRILRASGFSQRAALGRQYATTSRALAVAAPLVPTLDAPADGPLAQGDKWLAVANDTFYRAMARMQRLHLLYATFQHADVDRADATKLVGYVSDLFGLVCEQRAALAPLSALSTRAARVHACLAATPDLAALTPPPSSLAAILSSLRAGVIPAALQVAEASALPGNVHAQPSAPAIAAKLKDAAAALNQRSAKLEESAQRPIWDGGAAASAAAQLADVLAHTRTLQAQLEQLSLPLAALLARIGSSVQRMEALARELPLSDARRGPATSDAEALALLENAVRRTVLCVQGMKSVAWSAGREAGAGESEVKPDEPTVADDDEAGATGGGDDSDHVAVVELHTVLFRSDAFVRTLRASIEQIDALLPLLDRQLSSHVRGLLSHVLAMVAPMSHLAALYRSALMLAHHHMTHLLLVLCNVALPLLKNGFCRPPPPADEKDNKDDDGDGEFEADGTGMGEGAGAKDVSDQIENEGQLLGSQFDKGQPPPPDEMDENGGIEMQEQFDGDMMDLKQPEPKDGDDEQDEGEEVDREMGDVGDDADVVDEKLWEGDDDDVKPQDDETTKNDRQVEGGESLEEMTTVERDGDNDEKRDPRDRKRDDEKPGADGDDQDDAPKRDEKQPDARDDDANPLRPDEAELQRDADEAEREERDGEGEQDGADDDDDDEAGSDAEREQSGAADRDGAAADDKADGDDDDDDDGDDDDADAEGDDGDVDMMRDGDGIDDADSDGDQSDDDRSATRGDDGADVPDESAPADRDPLEEERVPAAPDINENPDAQDAEGLETLDAPDAPTLDEQVDKTDQQTNSADAAGLQDQNSATAGVAQAEKPDTGREAPQPDAVDAQQQQQQPEQSAANDADPTSDAWGAAPGASGQESAQQRRDSERRPQPPSIADFHPLQVDDKLRQKWRERLNTVGAAEMQRDETSGAADESHQDFVVDRSTAPVSADDEMALLPTRAEMEVGDDANQQQRPQSDDGDGDVDMKHGDDARTDDDADAKGDADSDDDARRAQDAKERGDDDADDDRDLQLTRNPRSGPKRPALRPSRDDAGGASDDDGDSDGDSVPLDQFIEELQRERLAPPSSDDLFFANQQPLAEASRSLALPPIDVLTMRHDAEALLAQQSEAQRQRGDRLWSLYSSLTYAPSLELCESLRLILEPTLASKLQGDFKSGKRINMKRIIPYIASNFRKDKIWMRKTKPSRREFQIMLAIDDSESMRQNGAGSVALESTILIAQALAHLEVGQVGVMKFGATADLLHPFDMPFTEESGKQVLGNFAFDQRSTDVVQFLHSSLAVISHAQETAGATSSASSSGASIEFQQICFVMSDGILSNRVDVERLMRVAAERQILYVLVIIDCGRKSSILDHQMVAFPAGKLVRTLYLDKFPFPYYVVLRDITNLPTVLADALRQWFEMNAHK